MPQLQDVGLMMGGMDGRHCRIVELARHGIGLGGVFLQFLLGELLQVLLHNPHGPLLVGHGGQRPQIRQGHLRNGFGKKQPPLPAQALNNGLGSGIAKGSVSGAQILHGVHNLILIK